MSNSQSRTSFKQRLTTRERKVILFVGDILVVLLALVISLYAWATEDSWLGISLTFLLERPDPWFYLLPILWLFLMIPCRNLRKITSFQNTLKVVLISSLVSIAVYLTIFFLAPAKSMPRRGVIVFFIAAALLTLIWRRLFVNLFYIKSAMLTTIIVGAGKAGTRIAEIINTTPGVPYKVIGFIDDDPAKQGAVIQGYEVLGTSKNYFDIIESNQVTHVIMAISNHLDEEIFDALTNSEERGITVTTMPMVYEELLGRVPVHLLSTDWLLRSFYDLSHTSTFYEIAKRVGDILGALVGMLVLCIITPFVALATLIDSGRPIFYSQERLGLRGSSFNILKFRTMVQNAEQDGVARPASEHDSRITKVGDFLRRSHLDEMPQFINVLKGELSLVGPRAERPAIVKDLQRDVPFYRARLLVRPGITGWAQVNFGYASGAEENTVKLEYDLYYIKHRSLLMDLSVLFNTFKTIFGLKGR